MIVGSSISKYLLNSKSLSRNACKVLVRKMLETSFYAWVNDPVIE